MRIFNRRINTDNLRNILFGAEDSMISTGGVLFGVASADVYTQQHVLLTGLVVIGVEALSMGIGVYLTESEANDMSQSNTKHHHPLSNGILMFLSYFFFGSLILIPYVLTAPSIARFISVSLSLFLLLVLGYIPTKKVRSGLRMLVLGGFAIGMGFLIGELFKVA